MDSSKKEVGVWVKFEIFFNTINHALIGITTFYLVWYCQKYNFSDKLTLHAYLTTFGYQVLMAEGILSLYRGNTYTLFTPRAQKTRIHWIMQAVGGLLSLVGVIIEVINREQAGRTHISTLHSIYGTLSHHFCILMKFYFP